MASESILLRPGFWYAFIGLVIVVLFIYGMRINQDRTDLTKAKKELELRNEELFSCNEENKVKSNKISELNRTIAGQQQAILEQSNSLSLKETTISDLQSRVYDLENKPPRIEYRNKPEPYHPYGKGMCRLVVYTTCSNGGQTSVYIDDDYVGYLDRYFSSSASCNSTGTVAKVLLAGKHKLYGKDQSNRTWSKWITIDEDDCYTFGFTCK